MAFESNIEAFDEKNSRSREVENLKNDLKLLKERLDGEQRTKKQLYEDMMG